LLLFQEAFHSFFSNNQYHPTPFSLHLHSNTMDATTTSSSSATAPKKPEQQPAVTPPRTILCARGSYGGDEHWDEDGEKQQPLAKTDNTVPTEQQQRPSRFAPPHSPPGDEECTITEDGVTNEKFQKNFGVALFGGGTESANVRVYCSKCGGKFPLRVWSKFHNPCKNPTKPQPTVNRTEYCGSGNYGGDEYL
jgi:hypothetical protein